MDKNLSDLSWVQWQKAPLSQPCLRRPTRAARHSNRTTRDPCMHSACPRSQCVPNPSYRCTPRNEAAVQGFGVQKGSRIPTPPTGCLCGKPHCPRTGQQEKDSKQRPKDRAFPLVGHQGDMPIDVESCHWLPEKPAKKQGS